MRGKGTKLGEGDFGIFTFKVSGLLRLGLLRLKFRDYYVRDCYVRECYVRDCYVQENYVAPLTLLVLGTLTEGLKGRLSMDLLNKTA